MSTLRTGCDVRRPRLAVAVVACLWTVAAGCDNVGGTSTRHDAAAIDSAIDAARPARWSSSPQLVEHFFMAPTTAWTSPAACPKESEDTACLDCYHQIGQPWSLDRNENEDRFGEALALADFNGDGYPDLAVGAPGEDIGGIVDAGAVYVFLGTERGFEPWRRLVYEGPDSTGPFAEMQFGIALAAADFTSDGRADLAIGRGPHDLDSHGIEQSVVVYQGEPDGLNHRLEIALWQIDWHAEDHSGFGTSLATGDFNGDGLVDLAVGAPGQYVDTLGTTAGAVYLVAGDGDYFDLGSVVRLIPPAGHSSTTRFGETFGVGNLDGVAGDDVAVPVPEQNEVYTFVGDGSEHVTLHFPSYEAFDGSIVVGDLDGAGTDEVAVGGVLGSGVGVFYDLDGSPGSPVPFSVSTVDLGGFADVARVASMAPKGVHGEGPWLFVEVAEGIAPTPRLAVILWGYLGFYWDFSIGDTVGPGVHSGFGRRMAVGDVDGDGNRDAVVAAPAGSGAGQIYVFRNDGWPDWDAWKGDWEGAGHSCDDPLVVLCEDPMPSQVLDQETTPGDCDVCYVRTLPDGFLCGESGPDGDRLACLGGECVAFCLSHADGVACGDDTAKVCFRGACFARRGCGDGYREPSPGTPEWPREGCDDGNLLDGDACSSACEPVPLVVSSIAYSETAPSRFAPAVGEDERGELLFVYTSDSADGRRYLRARRVSGTGVPVRDSAGEDLPPITLASFDVGWNVEPSVAGLRAEDGGAPTGGWVVAWADPVADGDQAGIALRRVSPDGVLGPLQVINSEVRGPQRRPRAVSGAGAYVVVWVDEYGLEDPYGSSSVKGALFANDGARLVDEFLVSTGRLAQEPAFAAADGSPLFVWTEPAVDDRERSFVMGRLIGDDFDLGEVFAISGPGGAEPAVVAIPGGSQFVVAWVRRDPGIDYLGDILARRIDVSTVPPTLGPVFTVVERQPGEPPHAEVSPTLALVGAAGGVVAYEDGGHRRGVGFAAIGSATLPPEATTLASYLMGGLQGDVTLLSTSRGVWFTWSDANHHGLGHPQAYRSFFAFLLPHD